jgi:thiol-disulfide isomerase/thioredoxin
MVDKKRMAAALVAGTALAVGTAWFFGGFAGGGGETVSEPGLGNVAHRREAPRFALKESGGREHALDELRGNAVIVHFWASWCPPCIDELPAVAEYARKWEAKGLHVYAVSLDANWTDADKILKGLALPASWVNVLDPAHRSAEIFGSFQYPESYWVDRTGKIAKKWVGAQPWSSPAMSEATERFLVESARPSGAQ